MKPDIPYSKLRSFYYVARHCSSRKAALDLFVTEGAISQQIVDLERRLGRKLFERSHRKTVLTPDGMNLLNLIAPIVERCENIGLEFERISGRLRGEIKIASWTGMVLYVLPEYLAKFRATYPECDIILFNVSNKEIFSMVLAGEADVGIGSVAALPEEIIGEELWRFKRYCVAPLDHPLSKLEKVTFDDLAKYPIVLPDKGGTGGQYLETMLRSCNPNVRVVMETVSWEVVMKYVELGFGVSMVPGIVLQAKDKERLYFCNMSDADERVGFSRYGLLIRRGKYLTPGAQEFVRFLLPGLGPSILDSATLGI